jgi:hypothetical protein
MSKMDPDDLHDIERADELVTAAEQRERREACRALVQHSLEQVEEMHARGQISDQLFSDYCEMWTWTAVRWSNNCDADNKQEKYWREHGKDAFYAKINATRLYYGLELIEPPKDLPMI